jgi:hypothetical protein
LFLRATTQFYTGQIFLQASSSFCDNVAPSFCFGECKNNTFNVYFIHYNTLFTITDPRLHPKWCGSIRYKGTFRNFFNKIKKYVSAVICLLILKGPFRNLIGEKTRSWLYKICKVIITFYNSVTKICAMQYIIEQDYSDKNLKRW